MGGSTIYAQKRRSPPGEDFKAGGKGFEPLSTDPESVVLPLDEPPPSCHLNYESIR